MNTTATAAPVTQQTHVRPMQIVAETGLSESTVRRMITDGTLEAVRIGRSIFVTRDSLHRVFNNPAR